MQDGMQDAEEGLKKGSWPAVGRNVKSQLGVGGQPVRQVAGGVKVVAARVRAHQSGRWVCAMV